MQVKDTILTINGVEPGIVQAIKQHSKELGIELKGLVLVDKAYAVTPDRPIDTTGFFTEIICDFENHDELQRVLKPYMHRLLAVTCRFEASIEHFRQIIPFLPYVHTPSETSLVWATEKPLMRDRLRAYDEKLVPKYRYIEPKDVARLDEIMEEFTYPVIVKPGALAASLLVTACYNEEDLRRCLDETFSIIQAVYKRKNRKRKPSVLIEEKMEGDIYSIDAYVSPTGEIHCLPLVKVITAHQLGMPGFYCYRVETPVEMDEQTAQGAFEAAEASVRALNVSATTTHIELFLTKDGWKVIELGARMGGYREAMYREAYGIEHYYNDLAVRMGMEPIISRAPIRHTATLNIYAEQEGPIARIEGVEEARALESVVTLDVHAKPGDIALFADKGGQLIIDTVLSNKDPKKLEEDIARLEELVKIVIEAKSRKPALVS